ncbi:MAG: dTDP-glucose 4,6-dehydratase [Akkermansiaceae bacterium]
MRSLKSVLVTGGAGFIGSALVRKLLLRSEVERLIVLDSLTYAGNLQKLVGPDQDPRFHFTQGDVNDRELVLRILSEGQVSGTFHLAAESHVERSISSPEEFIRTNIAGTSSLLEATRSHCCPMVVCSTDEVYGSTPAHTRFSESSPLNPSSPYSASKASADLLAFAAVKTYGQDVVVSRCTNCYGPRQHPEKLIPRLIFHALRDMPLPIYGSGQQIRDWMHVDDCALGLIAAFERGGTGQIYHLGANTEHTNLGIARSILKKLHKPESLISHVTDRLGHDSRYALDVRRALQTLGWKARIPFRTGFEETVRELSSELRVG